MREIPTQAHIKKRSISPQKPRMNSKGHMLGHLFHRYVETKKTLVRLP